MTTITTYTQLLLLLLTNLAYYYHCTALAFGNVLTAAAPVTTGGETSKGLRREKETSSNECSPGESAREGENEKELSQLPPPPSPFTKLARN